MQADIIILGDNIFIGDKVRAGAIVVKDGMIQEVCDRERWRDYIGERTEVYDAGDHTVMPGFHDFHIHLTLGFLSENSVNFSGARSAEEAAQMVKDFADERPEDEWILGFSWYHIFWDKKKFPDKRMIDRVLPNRPVFLLNSECHGAWLNSKALEILKINKDTSAPPFGTIVKDETGEPNGILLETAMKLGEKALQMPRPKAKQQMRDFMKKANSLGITSVSDMLPLPGFALGDLSLYKECEDENELTVRTFFLAPLDGDLEKARIYREKYSSDKLNFSGLKQFLDGVATTYTALMVEPYSDNETVKGEPFLPPEMISDWVKEADKEAFRIRLHACGDGAVRLGLDLYEEAERENGRRDARHTIEHIEVIHPDDIDRFNQLGVIASMQPEHMAITETFDDNIYLHRLGEEREQYTWPIKTLTEAGASVLFGSDYPVVEINPMLEIYRAITRRFNDGKPQEGWTPEEKLTLSEALTNYTKGPAYGNFMENKLGTIEAGKLADIIVLDRDLFETDVEELREVKVTLTVMDGKKVYEDDKYGVIS